MIGINFVGPLTTTSSGNRYILTVTDLYSKWPEAYALLNKVDATVAKCMVSILSTYAIPQVVLSDNGSEFCNKVRSFFQLVMSDKHNKNCGTFSG